MALISCPECGREVSDKANACPHCGMPLTPAATPAQPLKTAIPDAWTGTPPLNNVHADSLALQKRQAARIAAFAIGGLVLLVLMVTCSQSEQRAAPVAAPPAPPPAAPIDQAAERQRYLTNMLSDKMVASQRVWQAEQLIQKYPQSAEATQARSALPSLHELVLQDDLGRQWLYNTSSDSMSGKAVHTAHVESTNSFNFDFPYSGAQKATLRVRHHPRWGNDIMFSIDKGQILCHSFSGCPIRVRFDDEKAVTYDGTEPDDNSSEMVFLPAYATLTAKMAKAKIMRIEVNVYQQGSVVGEFNVEGFKPEKLK